MRQQFRGQNASYGANYPDARFEIVEHDGAPIGRLVTSRTPDAVLIVDIALKSPSAMETWGYEDEDRAAANLWGHGLGLAQYDQPVISRIWSLDHPVEIKEGMTFALETQHGKRFRYGVRIEEMLIVHKDSIEIVSNFPVKQITVVDPLPGYGDHVK